jgi:hypothetical protein
LRTTAGPSARPIANATRGGDADGSRRKVHHRAPARVRRPSSVRRRKAERSRMRQIKPTDDGGPCHAAPSARRALPGCSSSAGSRACEHDAGCSVGTCASRDPPRRAQARLHRDIIGGRSCRTECRQRDGKHAQARAAVWPRQPA